MPDLVTTPPLTRLSEEEELFRDTVRDFAEREVRPRVAAMERASAVDPALLAKCFELGFMGIDIPESHGGASGNLLMTVLAVEELSAVDASVAIFVDVQNTLVNTLLRKWASDDVKRRYLPRLASDLLGAYALSEPESGSDALGSRPARRGGGAAGSSRGASSGSRTARRPGCSSCSRTATSPRATRGSPPSRWSEASGDSASARKRISSASAPRARAS